MIRLCTLLRHKVLSVVFFSTTKRYTCASCSGQPNNHSGDEYNIWMLQAVSQLLQYSSFFSSVILVDT